MVELNPKNVAVSKKIFGKDANIYCGSFLEDGWKRAFGIDKFDVIVVGGAIWVCTTYILVACGGSGQKFGGVV